MRPERFERTPARVYWELTRAMVAVVCGFHPVCGGSRDRAYAITSDVVAEDPLCAYEPAMPS